MKELMLLMQWIIRSSVLPEFVRYRIYYYIAKKNLNYHFTTPFYSYLFFGNLNSYIESHLFFWGYYEKHETNFVKKILSERDNAIVFDVGANCGYYSMLMSEFANQVFAFEPNTKVSQTLNNNILKNNITNIKLANIGLSNKEQHLEYYSPIGINQGTGSFIKDFNSNLTNSSETFQVEIGDDFVSREGIDRVDFIKIDVEGFEFNVLQGLKGTIRVRKPVIMFEFIYNNKLFSIQDVIDLFKTEYDFFQFEKGNNLNLIALNELQQTETIVMLPKKNSN